MDCAVGERDFSAHFGRGDCDSAQAMTRYLITGEERAPATLLLAHGAGAPMDSPFMSAIAALLTGRGLRVARFEFAYMAARREREGARSGPGAGKRPPPRAEKLLAEFETAIAGLGRSRPLIIGGKSLGGRVASMIAQERFEAGDVAGLLCLGYPFHPPARPERLRTAHFKALTAPTLIVQGERDPFGGREEVAGYALPGSVSLHWAPDGDHGLSPRKSSGRSEAENWREAADAVAGWIKSAI